MKVNITWYDFIEINNFWIFFRIGLAELFKTFLIYELENMPRRSINFANEKLYTKEEQKMTRENLYDTINRFLDETCAPYLLGNYDITNLDGIDFINFLKIFA